MPASKATIPCRRPHHQPSPPSISLRPANPNTTFCSHKSKKIGLKTSKRYPRRPGVHPPRKPPRPPATTTPQKIAPKNSKNTLETFTNDPVQFTSRTIFFRSSEIHNTMFKRQRTPEEHPTRPSPYAPSEKTDIKVGLAFRISNIPSHITSYQLFQFLDRLPRDLSRNDGQSNVLGWSFAPAATSADSGLYSTATVTFKTAPTIFQFPWTSRFVSVIDDSQTAIVDKHFYGLTPLSCSWQQATVEYGSPQPTQALETWSR